MKEGLSRHFFAGILLIVALVSLMVVLPFFTSIISGALLAFIFYPLYIRAAAKMHKKIAAFMVAALVVLLVTIPAVFVINSLTQQTSYLYIRAKQQIIGGEFIDDRCYEDSIICNTVKDVNSLLQDENIKTYAIDILNKLLAFITQKFSEFVFSLPRVVLNIIVMLFTMYYLLQDGPRLIKWLAEAAPLKVHHQEEILKQFGEVTKAVIYGSFIVALIQGALGAFGMWAFGIKSFLWWSIVMTFFALIPFIGTWVVWFPASLYLGLSGYLQAETGLIWRGIGLFFYGLLIISTIDNILKPFIVANRANVHPLLIFIGIIGGLFAFGFVGLLLGPIVLALLQTLLIIYHRETLPHKGPDTCIVGRKNHEHR